MSAAVTVVFYCAVGAYVVAAGVALAYFARADERLLRTGNGLAHLGAVLLLLTLVLRAVQWQRVPLTTMTDSLNLFVLLSTGIMMLVVRQEKMRSLLSFYLPPVALIGLVNAAVAHQYLYEPPRELHRLLLVVHVGLAFLAYALFFVASVTSLGYAFQAYRLKRRRTTGLFQRLPSLERLDRVLFRLIGAGYPLFAITVVLGFVWTYVDSELLGPRWWLAPKILMAMVMAGFYSVTFHSRRLGWLRGPKLAYFVFIGFTSLMTLYLALSVAELNNYNFWDLRT
jgi:HemX protein